MAAGDDGGAGRLRRVVLDTNVFVAAGFRPESAAARVVRAVALGRLALVWDRATRGETEAVLRRIPRLDWERFAPLFDEAGEHGGAVGEEGFGDMADVGDRKFAALAAAADAVLVTNDGGLLAHHGRGGLRAMTPAAFMAGAGGGGCGGA